ncbi:MAG: ABATE domain-containing protein, partial [Chloroflexi bacterium]|nr:ABATE domain-containing protein [Chloroflexota bacterium]
MEKFEQGGLVHPGKHNDDLFTFVGDALAFDVVNTERLVKGTRRDLMMSPDALTHWWHQAQLHYPTLELEQGNQEALTADLEVLDAFKVLRTALRQLFEDVMAEREIHEENLSLLNDTLKMGSQVLEQTSPGTFRLRDQPGPQPQARVL